MGKYAVTIQVDSLYYEVEAEDEDEAIQIAFGLADREDRAEFLFDCNECYEIEDEPEYTDEDV